MDNPLHEAAVALGRKGGQKGGSARAALLSPEQRSHIASHAAKKRWKRDSVYVPHVTDAWLEKLKSTRECVAYHDEMCPDYPLRQWIADAIKVNS